MNRQLQGTGMCGTRSPACTLPPSSVPPPPVPRLHPLLSCLYPLLPCLYPRLPRLNPPLHIFTLFLRLYVTASVCTLLRLYPFLRLYSPPPSVLTSPSPAHPSLPHSHVYPFSSCFRVLVSLFHPLAPAAQSPYLNSSSLVPIPSPQHPLFSSPEPPASLSCTHAPHSITASPSPLASSSSPLFVPLKTLLVSPCRVKHRRCHKLVVVIEAERSGCG